MVEVGERVELRWRDRALALTPDVVSKYPESRPLRSPDLVKANRFFWAWREPLL